MPVLCRLTSSTVVGVLVLLFTCPLTAQTWIEDSFEHFADGRPDDAGQNLFVSRDGKVQTIHRFDLNQDGYLDLVFNSTHDNVTFIPATVASVSADRQVSQSELAVMGSQRVAVDDLNKDGFPDLVFCPNRGGVQHGRRFVTIIWGGEDGWPAHRCHGMLPVHDASRLAVCDFNADAWPDIAVLCGPAWLPDQPKGEIIRVFFGGKDGFLLSRRHDLGVADAIDLAAGEMRGDGMQRLAVLTSQHLVFPDLEAATENLLLPVDGPRCVTVSDATNDGHVDLVVGTSQNQICIFPGTAGGEWKEAEVFAVGGASHVTVADLDADNRSDLVLTNFSTARAGGGEAIGASGETADFVNILWGHDDGFSTEHALKLAVAHAAATAVGDVNDDGHPDLAIAVHQGGKTLTADSLIYLGAGQHHLRRIDAGLTTTGASDTVIIPSSGSRPAGIVFCNSLGGTLREEVPLTVYWGGERGFDRNNLWSTPFASGYESTACDLNLDGYVDLLAVNSGHAGEAALSNPHLGLNIFWGSADGFDVDRRRTVVRERHLGTSNVADLNRDGYLDLVLGQFSPTTAGGTQELIIYYGGDSGFDRQRRVAIPSPGRSISTVIADFDRDEWLDVAVNSYEKDVIRIFRGSEQGFDATRQSHLVIHSPIDLETADLNADGWLDLIVGSYSDRLSGFHDTGTSIFWGNESGFRTSNAQWLPGFTPVGHCVADFDSDGQLDLFSPHYHANATRESIPSYLFWGGPDGFAWNRRTSLICDSAHDAAAADFNRDGRIDLAVVCHGRDGGHNTVSKVFYNNGQRLRSATVESVPTIGPHWMWQEDIGHIYHRGWTQAYRSSVFTWNRPRNSGHLSFKADVPHGTQLGFAVRTATAESQLTDQPWRDVDDGRFSTDREHRVMQYRATFQSDNGDRYPVLDQVHVELN